MHSIYAYINYRTFLNDYYEDRKQKNSTFSYRVFARQAGFSSPNFIKLVILGKRNLTNKSLPKILTALKLRKKEKEFFATLVNFNQAQSREEKITFFKKLYEFRAFKEIKMLEDQTYRYLSEWYHVVIRELVLHRSFKEDSVWIAKKLKGMVSEKEVKDSIKLLIDLGLLERTKVKTLKQSDRVLSTDQIVTDISVNNFHDNMIALAAEAIDQGGPETRDISSVTVAIDQKTYQEAKRRIQDFRRELNVLLSSCKKPEAVYQINFQIFNLTDVNWSDDE